MAGNAIIDVNMAKLTITYNGQQGDLPDMVSYDATEADLKQMATESVRGGYVPGIDAAPNADFRDFVVDRFPARQDVPYNRLSLRPKTPFGAEDKEQETGVAAIIFLQKMAGIEEPMERAKASWASFSEHEKEVTLRTYKAMGGTDGQVG